MVTQVAPQGCPRLINFDMGQGTSSAATFCILDAILGYSEGCPSGTKRHAAPSTVGC